MIKRERKIIPKTQCYQIYFLKDLKSKKIRFTYIILITYSPINRNNNNKQPNKYKKLLQFQILSSLKIDSRKKFHKINRIIHNIVLRAFFQNSKKESLIIIITNKKFSILIIQLIIGQEVLISSHLLHIRRLINNRLLIIFNKQINNSNN